MAASPGVSPPLHPIAGAFHHPCHHLHLKSQVGWKSDDVPLCVCMCVCMHVYIGWSEKSLSEMVYLILRCCGTYMFVGVCAVCTV